MGDVATNGNQNSGTTVKLVPAGNSMQLDNGVHCTTKIPMTLTESQNQVRVDSAGGTLISTVTHDRAVENHAIPKTGKSVLVGNDGNSFVQTVYDAMTNKFLDDSYKVHTQEHKLEALASSLPKIGFQCTMNPGIVDPSQLGQIGRQSVPNDPTLIARRNGGVRLD